tara:strand:- start:359 stop:865 length:507 start_codon:yes stop_codon:yes gene_type:complete
MYKDNPNNRRLNRVGKPLGSVKDPANKTLSGTATKGRNKGKVLVKYKLPKDEEKLKKLQEETKKLKSMVSKPVVKKTLETIPKDTEKLKKLQEEITQLKRMVRIQERPGDKPRSQNENLPKLKQKYLNIKNRLEKNGTLSLKDQTQKRQLEILIGNRQKDNWLSKNKF